VNVLNAAEPAAWQTVFHFHLHVIPRYEDDPLQLPTRPSQADQEELAAVAEELRG
jgi:histidine triad (HIT) family protein